MSEQSRRPRIAIGVPVLNGGEYLEETLDSLLAQSYTDFSLLVLDNCSTDATPETGRRAAARDPRVRYRRNPETVGMVENFRRAFRYALEEFGELDYFAWGSAHDVWLPRWLERLVPELDADPGLVVAFPQWVAIHADGALLDPDPRHGDTAGLANPSARVRRVASGRFPNVAHGLFRADALDRCGVVPSTVGPDVLLMTQLAVLGRFKEVPRELWVRRIWSHPRPHQRTRLFSGRPPVYTHLPEGLVHTAILFRWLVLRAEGRPEVGRAHGARIVALYSLVKIPHLFRRWRKKSVLRIRIRSGYRWLKSRPKAIRKHRWTKLARRWTRRGLRGLRRRGRGVLRRRRSYIVHVWRHSEAARRFRRLTRRVNRRFGRVLRNPPS